MSMPPVAARIEPKVHGLQGLRVVDASIMPGMVCGNTQAAVFMIAENGSDLIVEDERRGA